jgi:aryl-alcohol dehydrogenase-like predicted oxidoreductase
MNLPKYPEGIKPLPKVELGNTGLKVSRLSFGTGTAGWQGRSDQSDLGVDKLAGLLQLAYDHGINFWDTADAYGTHPHVTSALQEIPRDKVVIVTKTLSKKASQVSRDIDRFLEELDTDYIDIVLLHVMTHADWPRQYAGAMEVLSRAKQAGKVRALGISCHSLKALQTAAETDWSEVVMVRINYAGVNTDASPQIVVPILEDLYASGKAVYGMKVLGNGRLSSDVGSAIEYVLKLGTIHAITIGITNQAQLIENIQLVSELSPQYPLRS